MPEITLINQPILISDVKKIAEQRFGDMVKAVVDLEQKIMAIGAELHADEEAFLLEKGSKQQNLWGVNIYVGKSKEERIEFDSMINIRPSQNNRSRSVEDAKIQEQILQIVDSLIQ